MAAFHSETAVENAISLAEHYCYVSFHPDTGPDQSNIIQQIKGCEAAIPGLVSLLGDEKRGEIAYFALYLMRPNERAVAELRERLSCEDRRVCERAAILLACHGYDDGMWILGEVLRKGRQDPLYHAVIDAVNELRRSHPDSASTIFESALEFHTHVSHRQLQATALEMRFPFHKRLIALLDTRNPQIETIREYLRTFNAFVEYKTLNQASHALYCSRQTVANHLQCFGRMLGMQLTESIIGRGVPQTRADRRSSLAYRVD